MQEPTIKTLQVNYKTIELLQKVKRLGYIKHPVTKAWSEAVSECPDYIRLYCNKKGVKTITISYEAAEKVISSKMGKSELYVRLVNVKLVSLS